MLTAVPCGDVHEQALKVAVFTPLCPLASVQANGSILAVEVEPLVPARLTAVEPAGTVRTLSPRVQVTGRLVPAVLVFLEMNRTSTIPPTGAMQPNVPAVVSSPPVTSVHVFVRSLVAFPSQETCLSTVT